MSEIQISLLRERHPRVAQYMSDTADCEMQFGRTDVDDQFTAVIRATGHRAPPLGIHDVLVITPVGNDWIGRLDATSLFVIPFQSVRRSWVAIGMEAVVRHATRGAHPISHAFIYECPQRVDAASDAIRMLAGELAEDQSIEHRHRRAVPLGTCTRAGDDRLLDALMLRKAVDEFGRGRPLFVRTQLLSSTMHPNVLGEALSSLDQRVIGQRYIVGIVDGRQSSPSLTAADRPPQKERPIVADAGALSSVREPNSSANPSGLVRSLLRVLLGRFGLHVRGDAGSSPSDRENGPSS
jgi:hypothetical protein